MFVAHGGPGFWVRRTTWGGTCARIVRVGQITQPAPYFGNPSVLMDVYTLKGELKDAAAALPAAGTYKTWRQIGAPEWATTAKLRLLDDPELDEVLARLDRKRHKGPTATQEEPGPAPAQVWLKVPFARKDEAKELGARWSPADRAWWLQETDTAALSEARRLGFLTDG